MSSKASGKIKDSMSDRIFIAIVYILLGVTALIVLYPLLFVLAASVSDPNAVNAGKVWLLPVGFKLQG